MHYVIELESGVWAAPWEGDPGRTLVIDNAEYFKTETEALKKARSIVSEYRYFRNAKVYPVDADEMIAKRKALKEQSDREYAEAEEGDCEHYARRP